MNQPDLFSAIPFENLYVYGFWLLFFVFIIHCAVVAFHWITYGTHRFTAFLALAAYGFFGAILLLALYIAIP